MQGENPTLELRPDVRMDGPEYPDGESNERGGFQELEEGDDSQQMSAAMTRCS